VSETGAIEMGREKRHNINASNETVKGRRRGDPSRQRAEGQYPLAGVVEEARRADNEGSALSGRIKVGGRNQSSVRYTERRARDWDG